MASWSWERCPHCNATYRLGRSYRGFGAPFETCGECGQYFRSASHNEWDLLSTSGKASWIALAVSTAIFYWAFGAGLIAFMALYFLGELRTLSSQSIALIVGAFSFGGLLTYSVMFRRWVRESQARLQNHEYRETLRGLGFRLPEK